MLFDRLVESTFLFIKFMNPAWPWKVAVVFCEYIFTGPVTQAHCVIR